MQTTKSTVVRGCGCRKKHPMRLGQLCFFVAGKELYLSIIFA